MMNIDQNVLKDLEIFKTEEREISVYDRLFKTITGGGQFRLREKFMHPPASLESTLEHQETVAFLTKNIRLFYLPYNDHQAKSLEEYISTNIEVVKNESLWESLRFFLTDLNAYNYINYSMQDVIAFTGSFYNLLYEKKDRLPALLKKAFKELDTLLHNHTFRNILNKLMKKKRSIRNTLVTDRILRTTFKPNLIRILEWYYELDALLAMAKATHENRFVFPFFTNNKTTLFKANGLYHPLLKNPVPVDIEIGNNKNLIYLTGPNMSGKTTFLKSVGLAVYLGHLGMGMPATYAEISYFDRLFTSINITDNILAGYSFFFSEVVRIKELGKYLQKKEKIFVLFDELFRGTNVNDAYDATIMIIEKLASWVIAPLSFPVIYGKFGIK